MGPQQLKRPLLDEQTVAHRQELCDLGAQLGAGRGGRGTSLPARRARSPHGYAAAAAAAARDVERCIASSERRR